MKHDFSHELDGINSEEFISWVLSETTAALSKDYGDAEATKSTIFLLVNRAFESKMPEEKIAVLFAKMVVDVGYSENEQDALFAWLDHFGQIAKATYSDS